jgi:GTP-binding protein
MVDIPGIIEGASQGAGLGLEFLRHVERVRVILCLVDMAFPYSGDPWKDFSILRREFSQYSASLLEKPFIVVGTKLDLPEAQKRWEHFAQGLAQEGMIGVGISAVTHFGLSELLDRVVELLRLEEKEEISLPSSLRERGVQERSPRVYRFASRFLEKLLKEYPPEKDEASFHGELERSGFLRYLGALPPGSTVEIGSYRFVWTGKGLVLSR